MDKRIETKCVQAGWTPKNGEPRQVPIYQSTTFKYDTSKEMGDLFDLKSSGYFYTRLQNPTNDYVANQICELEGGYRLPLDFPVGLAGLGGTELGRSLGNLTGGLPFTVVLGQGGRVLHRKMGQVTPDDLKQWVHLR